MLRRFVRSGCQYGLVCRRARLTAGGYFSVRVTFQMTPVFGANSKGKCPSAVSHVDAVRAEIDDIHRAVGAELHVERPLDALA